MSVKKSMYEYEDKYYGEGYKLIAGTDEAGRGSWAGPIVVAMAILPKGYKNDAIDDSKKLSEEKREILFEQIIKDALDYNIVFIDAKEVDKLNPKKASILGMESCIESIKTKPDIVLIDAEHIKSNIKTVSIIKGDAKSITIAAASILAKVSRDRYMRSLDKKYPNYYFAKHKGYGTALHLAALKVNSPIEGLHRFSYEPIKNLLMKRK
ncbi:MAG: ribonuclease HII [Mycoplasmataceae bacterium]|nr:ribonuclease HII [Mycoplasmataceae bacterium]